MKTLSQLNVARKRLKQRILTPGLTEVQRALIVGMMNAVVWAADGADSTTMERMLSDEPLDAGKDHSAAMERLKRMVEER